MARRVGVLFLLIHAVAAHLITSSARLPRVEPTAYPGVGVGLDELFGRVPGHQLFKRRVNCDQSGNFFCPTGTCFTDDNNSFGELVGCCTVSSCAPRTTCIPYTSGITSACDINTGGCLYCADQALPVCMTLTNAGANQWIQYCDSYSSTETISYSNTITHGSHVDDASTTSSSSPNSTPVPGMQVKPSTTFTSSSTVQSSTSAASVSASGNFSGPCMPGECERGSAGPMTSPVGVCPTGGNASASTSGGHQVNERNNRLSGGTLAGIVCAAVAAGALICAAIWFTRKYWRRKCCSSRTDVSHLAEQKHASDESSPPSSSGEKALVEAEGSTPRRSHTPFSPDHFSRHPELDSREVGANVPSNVHNGLGIGGMSSRRYAPTNPDPSPTSVTDHAPQLPEHSSEPTLDYHSPVSPPHSGSATPPACANGPVSPMTPATKTFVPYTPSNYGVEPPSSVPRTIRQVPPSMPQEYSAVSLGSVANIYRGSSMPNIYRGLSKSGGGEAPWAYLSAEDARRGGWRNEEGGA